MKKFGIDISKWKKGLSMAKCKAEGVEFVIIRAMCGINTDSCFEAFYKECEETGLPVGAFLYSKATTAEEAKAEAEALIPVLAGKKFEYPIYIDIEEASQKKIGKDKLDAIVKTFCERMEKAGYYAGFYCNTDFYLNYMNGATLAKRFTHWRASWSKSEVTGFPMWQFGGETNEQRSNMVAGQVVDQNYCYVDFPTIIKNAKLNGFGTAQKPAVSAEKPAQNPASNYVGKTVKVKSGAKYGGLTSARGTAVPSYIIGQSYVVVKTEQHKGVCEALLKGLNSWIALSSLDFSNAKVMTFNNGDRVKVKVGAKWTTGSKPASWVFKSYLFCLDGEDANGIVKLSTSANGAVTGKMHKNYLTKI